MSEGCSNSAMVFQREHLEAIAVLTLHGDWPICQRGSSRCRSGRLLRPLVALVIHHVHGLTEEWYGTVLNSLDRLAIATLPLWATP